MNFMIVILLIKCLPFCQYGHNFKKYVFVADDSSCTRTVSGLPCGVGLFVLSNSVDPNDRIHIMANVKFKQRATVTTWR